MNFIRPKAISKYLWNQLDDKKRYDLLKNWVTKTLTTKTHKPADWEIFAYMKDYIK